MNRDGHASGDARAARDYITTTVGGQLFGLALDRVHHVFRPRRVTPVPLARREIAGIVNMRGRIVTTIDMRRRLDLPERGAGEPCMVVGIDRGGESCGLMIDGVGDVIRLPAEAMEPGPVNLHPRRSAVCAGVYRLDGRLMTVLDIDRVFEPEYGA